MQFHMIGISSKLQGFHVVGTWFENCNHKNSCDISLESLSRVGVFHWMSITMLSYSQRKQFGKVCEKAWMLILNAIMMKFQQSRAAKSTILVQ